jgi:F-type H+-transporting ATPase subunit b
MGRLSRICVLGCCLLLLGCGKEAKEEHAPKKLELQYTEHTHKKPIEIDPTNPEHRAKVLEAIHQGEAEALITKRTVNLMEWRWELGIWSVVVFILLFLILRKLAWGPMLEGLHKREESIFGALNEAEKARAEAKTLREQFEKEMAKIGDKSRELMDEARRNAQKLQEEMMAKAKSEIGTERERLHREIDMARDQALKHIWDQTAQLATLVSAKAIKRDLGVEDHRRLIDEAVAELGSTIAETRREAWRNA